MQRLIVCVAIALSARAATAQIKAFPQAEGFGAASVGGRGGDVYHVTNLSNSDVGGWIDLTSNLGIVGTKRKITIAGQTAPGGIGVRGGKFSVGADDVIIRHMRFKPGKASGRNDSVNTNNEAERVIYDHISAGFSWDENFSVQATNVTLQFSSVAHGLEDHSAGSLLENPHSLTMHHNLYAHNDTRNPKHRVHETLDFVDNVVYNWNDRAFYMQGTDSTGYFWTSNIDGNYFIAGPNHGSTKPVSGGSVDDYGTWWGVNKYDADRDAVDDGIEYTRETRGFGDIFSALTTWSATPYPTDDPIWKEDTTQAAYLRTLSEFGATPWDRDEVDTLLHSQVVNRNGSIISHENQLVALGVTNGGFGTLGGAAAPVDTDQDGMPDAWEAKHGLSPTTASNNGDFDNDGYTNLEEYINDLAAFKAAGPLEFQASLGRYADWTNWTRRWEPSRVDDVHINDGEAVVDAVGQKAGNIRLGTTAGANGVLGVEGGWLEVSNEIVIGATATASGELNLSGGVLAARSLSKNEGGVFNFTGGTLHAAVVNFSFVNDGGTIAPGFSPGTLSVDGDLTLNSGLLLVEIGGTAAGQFDALDVSGLTTLGGVLQFVTVDLGGGSYVPQLGDQFTFLNSAGGIEGEFDSMRFPAIGEGLKWQVVTGEFASYLAVVSAALAGDYNDNGTVDAADYTTWRDALDSNTPLLNETETPGVVDAADYDAWKANFGATAVGAGSGAVPEPVGGVLWLVGLGTGIGGFRKFRLGR